MVLKSVSVRTACLAKIARHLPISARSVASSRSCAARRSSSWVVVIRSLRWSGAGALAQVVEHLRGHLVRAHPPRRDVVQPVGDPPLGLGLFLEPREGVT